MSDEQKSGGGKAAVIGLIVVAIIVATLTAMMRLGAKTMIDIKWLWAIALASGLLASIVMFVLTRKGRGGKSAPLSSFLTFAVINTAIFGPLGTALFLAMNYYGAGAEQSVTYPIEAKMERRKRGVSSYSVEITYNGIKQQIPVDDNPIVAKEVDLKIAKGLFGVDVVKQTSTSLGLVL
jgi:hypothetical protein